MSKLKIKWKVQDPPAGRYRSFERRGWPTAYYGNENSPVCASVECIDPNNGHPVPVDYVPSRAKTGDHPELTLRIADHSRDPQWKWVVAKKRFKTLDELKAGLLELLEKNPHLVPKPKEEPK